MHYWFIIFLSILSLYTQVCLSRRIMKMHLHFLSNLKTEIANVIWVITHGRLNIKMVFPGIGTPITKIMWPWYCSIFIMGIFILVRECLYIETTPCLSFIIKTTIANNLLSDVRNQGISSNSIHPVLTKYYGSSTTRIQPGDRQISNIRHTKSQNLIFSRLVLQLFLRNLLKPGVKSITKM